MDDVDAVCADRNELRSGSQASRLISILLYQMDGIVDNENKHRQPKVLYMPRICVRVHACVVCMCNGNTVLHLSSLPRKGPWPMAHGPFRLSVFCGLTSCSCWCRALLPAGCWCWVILHCVCVGVGEVGCRTLVPCIFSGNPLLS